MKSVLGDDVYGKAVGIVAKQKGGGLETIRESLTGKLIRVVRRRRNRFLASSRTNHLSQ